MTVGLGDVAKAAGVSRATASRALSGHPSVLPETRQRVLLAASELEYRADPVARALRAGSSNLIGLIVTNLQNPAIQEVAETVQELGQQEGYEVLIATTNDDPAREHRLLSALSSRRVDGLLVMATDGNAARLNALFGTGVPLVELIRRPEPSRVPGVVYDDRRAGALAAGHLLDLGHRAIAFIGGPPDTRSGRERHVGFVQAHTDRGLETVPGLLHRGPFRSEFGSAAVDTLFRDSGAAKPGAGRPTAAVLANHEAMFAALQALSRRGLAIPDDLSIVAVEEDPLLPWWHPPVTTVDVRPRDLAARAMARLLEQIRPEPDADGAEAVRRRERPLVTVDVQLVLRQSTAPA